MVSKLVNIITGLIALGLMGTFTIGLTYSISTGFAGFQGTGGGIVIALIVGFVLLLAAYDLFNTAVRRK